ncbi:MAG: DUF4426 domain-containing protein [Pseudomonadota bacterium]|nr:DUF4426 domain-containing protein [Pseudomonadota bacterium]
MKPLLLPALLAITCALPGCNREPAPKQATAPGHTDQVTAEKLRVGDAELEVRLINSQRLSEAMGQRYGVARDADNWLLLISPRSATGEAITLDGLVVEARAGSLIETPAGIALRVIEAGDYRDLIGEIKAKPPTTLRIEIDANRGGQRGQLRFSRDLTKAD